MDRFEKYRGDKPQVLFFTPDGKVRELASVEEAKRLSGTQRHIVVEVFQDAVLVRGVGKRPPPPFGDA